MTAQADIGVFGGSGFYSFLEDVEHVQVQTPYGAPSSAVAIGSLDGRSVAFLARHGAEHQTPAHMVNYRANIWAMRELGVTRLVGPSAAGSLQPDVAPGDVVVLDQLIDRTSGRKDTFFDGPLPGHVSLADPYCPELGEVFKKAGADTGMTVHDEGTVVVIQGPRFSTRAESRWFRNNDWHAVNMTQYPEVALAREVGICYCGLALITDFDAGLEGVEGIKPVEMDQVFATLRDNVEHTRELLRVAIGNIPEDRACKCGSALDSGPLRRS